MKSYEAMTKQELIKAIRSLEKKQGKTPEQQKKAARRKGTEEAFEVRVQERTAELETINQALRKEMTARQRAEEQFREMIESAPDAIVIVNSQGQILRVNIETVKMFGYRREEILQQPVEVLLPERFRRGHIGIGRPMSCIRKPGRWGRGPISSVCARMGANFRLRSA